MLGTPSPPSGALMSVSHIGCRGRSSDAHYSVLPSVIRHLQKPHAHTQSLLSRPPACVHTLLTDTCTFWGDSEDVFTSTAHLSEMFYLLFFSRLLQSALDKCEALMYRRVPPHHVHQYKTLECRRWCFLPAWLRSASADFPCFLISELPNGRIIRKVFTRKSQ